MNDLPDPLVPAGCDLTGYGFMPLYGHRLFGSDFNSRCTDSEWRAGLTLWWAAWNQVPGGSLPDDDAALCRLADLGRNVKAWKKLRANTLSGWSKCSDGRLYHPVLAKIALDSWEKRLASQHAREEDRERLRKWRQNKKRIRDGNDFGNGVRNADETDFDTDSKRLGERSDVEVKAAAAAAEDPRLAAAAAAGAYLEFKGADVRAEWLTEIGDLPPERVTDILAKERLPDGGRIRLPSGFTAALLAIEQRRAKRLAKAREERPDEFEVKSRRAREARSIMTKLRQPELAEHLARAEDDIRRAAAKLLADEPNAWLATEELAAVSGWMAEAAP